MLAFMKRRWGLTVVVATTTLLGLYLAPVVAGEAWGPLRVYLSGAVGGCSVGFMIVATRSIGAFNNRVE